MMAGGRLVPSGKPASRGLLAMVLGALAVGIALGAAGFGAGSAWPAPRSPSP